MIYTPTKYPKKAFILISFIVFIGILGGYFISEYFLAIALVFWMQYTAVLSYLQFKKKSKHSNKTFTEILLNPFIRFFIFELIAFWGIVMLIWWNNLQVGSAALLAWWLFSLNFYLYYRKEGKTF
jgi:hypothetical protein